MDNRIFNVNGKGDEFLLKTLELAFLQQGGYTAARARGWSFTKKHGLILHWHVSEPRSSANEVHRFPGELTAVQCLPFVSAWLESPEAKTVETLDQDSDYDHDGSNGRGWRVFCEAWGHVNNDSYAFIAIKPAYMWYGK